MSNKLWVGSLPAGTEGAELEEVFAKFGRIRKVWVARNPPGFAFVEVRAAGEGRGARRCGASGACCCVAARCEKASKESESPSHLFIPPSAQFEDRAAADDAVAKGGGAERGWVSAAC